MLFYSFYSFYIHVRDMNCEGKEKKKKNWLFGIGADVITEGYNAGNTICNNNDSPFFHKSQFI